MKKLIDNKLGNLNGTIMVSNTFENVLANTEYKFDSPVSLNGVYSSSMYKLQPGSTNLSNNLKEFNDTTSKDFIKNTNEVVIDNDGAKIIDSAKLTPSYNNETGFYESNNPNFTDITNINVVNNTMTLSDTDKGNYVTLNADKLSGAITTGFNFVRGTKYFNKGKKSLNLLKAISLIVIFFGAFLSSNFLWNLVDILTALLAVINGYAMFILRQEVIEEYTKYYKCDKI